VWNYKGELGDFTPGDSVVFEVYDKDFGKTDDFLGKRRMQSHEFFPNGFEGELSLCEGLCGESENIEAYIKIKIDPCGIVEPGADSTAVGTAVAYDSGRGQATPDLGFEHTASPRLNSGIQLPVIDDGAGEMAEGQLGVLSVRIIAAFNLVNMDTGILGDVSDPFVQFWLVSSEQQSQKTKTINNNLNPVWNTDPYIFPITMQDDLLHLEVWDEDTFTANDLLGRLTIPLYNIVCGEPNQAIRLRDHLQDTKHGELEVEVAFSPNLG
jgi:hypothetical protein